MKLFSIVLIVACFYNYSSGCSVEIDMDYRGIPNTNDIRHQVTATFQECCDLCSNDPTQQCNAWTYVYIDQKCWLKTGVGYRLPTVGSKLKFSSKKYG